jgi:hypothetical protein
MRKKLKLSSDGGDSGSKKYNASTMGSGALGTGAEVRKGILCFAKIMLQ